MENLFDVCIVGAGPAGLYTAFQTRLNGLKTCLLEANASSGGKINTYAERVIRDIGGFSEIIGFDLIDQLMKQATLLNPDSHFNAKVTDITKTADGHFILKTQQHEYQARSIILAMGRGIVQPKLFSYFEKNDRPYPLNIHHQLTPFATYRQQKLVLTGEGNNLVEWTALLAPYASQIDLLFPDSSLKGPTEIIETLKQLENVSLYPESTIEKFTSHAQKLQQVTLQTGQKLDLDYLIAPIGYQKALNTLKNWHLPLEITAQNQIKTTFQSTTNDTGVFVIGDQASYDGKIGLIASAFQEGAQAAQQVLHFLKPAAPVAMISTHNPKLNQLNQTFYTKNE